eukprot:15444068-Alexandrium_andersonii.AAC.1
MMCTVRRAPPRWVAAALSAPPGGRSQFSPQWALPGEPATEGPARAPRAPGRLRRAAPTAPPTLGRRAGSTVPL